MSNNNFGSLISELTGTASAPPPSRASLTTRPRHNDTTSNPSARPVSPQKRKPEEGVGGPPPKLPRSDAQKPSSNSAPRPGSSSGLAPKAAALSLNKLIPGTTPKSSPAATKPPPTTATANNTSKPTTSAPPKGSYRDIMSRARAAQATQVSQPQLPQAAPARRGRPMGRRMQERMEARQRAKQRIKEERGSGAAAKATKTAKVTKALKSKAGGAQSLEPLVKKKKDRPPLEYKGTMRGNSTATRTKLPSGKLNATAKKNPTVGYSSASGSELDAPDLGKRYRYATYSDEEEEEEEEEGYDSRGSSDMEGGGFDTLEAEEEASLRAARKEDAEALREEEAHRKEKLERKNKLAALAAKAKPPKY